MSRMDARRLVHVLQADEARLSGNEAWGTMELVFRSVDRTRAAGVWGFGPGSFDYVPNHEEFLYVIDGSVSLSVDAELPIVLRQGDLAYLPAHVGAHWSASVPVRAAFCSIAFDSELDY